MEEKTRDEPVTAHWWSRGLGYAVLGLACEALAVAFYICWVLPKCAWLNFTGQIPRHPRDPQTWQSHDKEGKF